MMKGNPLRKRLIVLVAAAALLMVGAVPVYAAPGGIPGPPAGHEKSHGNPHDAAPAPDDDTEATSHVPDWANAYGRRILDEFGMTYGHLQQCANQSDETVAPADEDDTGDEAFGNPNLTCPEGEEEQVQFPEDDPGAKAFWLFFLMSKLVTAT